MQKKIHDEQNIISNKNKLLWALEKCVPHLSSSILENIFPKMLK